ncbi:MAG: hypothetical protein HY323_11500 [Betaproteobacteria bacterium]|nr:hypothetical protein [Betaproteobacteria bacterium]
MKYYVLTIYDRTEPALSDPYTSESERNEEAVNLLEETDPEEDAVFLMDVDEGGAVDISLLERRDIEEEPEEREE